MKATIARWTCDRCKVVIEVAGGQQPLDWTVFVSGGPPDVSLEGHTRYHLCPACTDILDLALAPLKAEGFRR